MQSIPLTHSMALFAVSLTASKAIARPLLKRCWPQPFVCTRCDWQILVCSLCNIHAGNLAEGGKHNAEALQAVVQPPSAAGGIAMPQLEALAAALEVMLPAALAAALHAALQVGALFHRQDPCRSRHLLTRMNAKASG